MRPKQEGEVRRLPLIEYGVHIDNQSTTPIGKSREPAHSLPLAARRIGQRKIGWWLVAGDGVGLALAWPASFGLLWLIYGKDWFQGVIGWWAELGGERAIVFGGLFALSLVVFGVRGHYTRRRPFSDEAFDIAKVFLVVAVLDALLVYLGKSQFSRSWLITAWFLAFALVLCARALVKSVLIRAHQWHRPVAVIGVGPNAREAAEALHSEPLMGFQVKAFLSLPGDQSLHRTMDIGEKSVPVLQIGSDPYIVIDGLGISQIVVALEAENLIPQQKLVQQLSTRYSDICIIPPLRGLPLYGMEMTHFFSHEVLMLTVRNNLARPGPRIVKRIFDFLASAVLLVLLAPLLVFFSWRIRRAGGNAIFGHVRVGQYGRSFRCFKFRTMVPDAERVLEDLLLHDEDARIEWEQNFKLRKDPRVTQIGSFLRATSLDELPQLWNVLKGEMSLVGPRPVVEEELERYGDQVGYYLESPPGMTGLWQISGRSGTGYDDRVALDCWYVRNWSLWYDLVVLIKTIRVVLKKEGAY